MASPSFTQLALHLADRSLATITSSSRQSSSSPGQMRSQAQALSSLTNTAIIAYETASRLGLGLPERILIETQSSGPIVLHSYLNPPSVQAPRSWQVQNRDSDDDVAEQTRAGMRSVHDSADDGHADQQGQSHEGLLNGVGSGETGAEELDDDSLHRPSLLIATVVAPTSADGGIARRAAARLERTGRTFQREWVREQEQREHLDAGAAEEEDG